MATGGDGSGVVRAIADPVAARVKAMTTAPTIEDARFRGKYRDGEGVCVECSGACDIRAFRCRACRDGRPELVCPKCDQKLPREEFQTPNGTRHAYCTACNKAWHRNRRYLKAYGISADDYDLMLERQGGVCAICREPAPKSMRGKILHVDHCHSTGAVRGLLCQPCNVGLGGFRDRAELLTAAMDYLATGLSD